MGLFDKLLTPDGTHWSGNRVFWKIDPDTGELVEATADEFAVDGPGDEVAEQASSVSVDGPKPDIKVATVAKILGCSPKTVHRLCNEGRLSFHWVGKRRKFRITDLEEFWVDQRQNATYRERLRRTLAAARLSKSEQTNANKGSRARKAVSSEESKELTVDEIRALCRR